MTAKLDGTKANIMNRRTPTAQRIPATTPESGKRKLESWIQSFVDQTANLHSPPIFPKVDRDSNPCRSDGAEGLADDFAAAVPNLYTFLVAHPGVGKTRTINEGKALYPRTPRVPPSANLDDLRQSCRLVWSKPSAISSGPARPDGIQLYVNLRR